MPITLLAFDVMYGTYVFILRGYLEVVKRSHPATILDLILPQVDEVCPATAKRLNRGKWLRVNHESVKNESSFQQQELRTTTATISSRQCCPALPQASQCGGTGALSIALEVWQWHSKLDTPVLQATHGHESKRRFYNAQDHPTRGRHASFATIQSMLLGRMHGATLTSFVELSLDEKDIFFSRRLAVLQLQTGLEVGTHPILAGSALLRDGHRVHRAYVSLLREDCHERNTENSAKTCRKYGGCRVHSTGDIEQATG